MSNVYLVHTESGEYSEHLVEPHAVFTTREKAVAWIEGMRIPVIENEYVHGLTTNEYAFREKVVAYARPTTKGDDMWMAYTTEDGRPLKHHYFEDAWYIDELPLDPEVDA